MNGVRLKHAAFLNAEALPEDTDPHYSFRYVDISQVDASGRIDIPEEEIEFASSPSRARRVARAGDTVISTVRTYLRAIARVPATERDLIFSTGFAVVSPREGVHGPYLSWACQSEPFVSEVVARSTGVSYPATNPSELAMIRVPLPPLDVQRRIADFLDDQVGRMMQVQNSRRDQQALLADRAAASGAAMIESLRATQWARLNRFWRSIEQGGSPLGTGTRVLGAEPGVVKTSCVKHGSFFPDENKALADHRDYEARYRLVAGDLLIVRGSGSGDLVADCAVVTDEVAGKNLMLSDLVYRPTGLRLNPNFVCAYLLTPQGKAQLRPLVRQGSGPAKVRGEDIGSIRIPVLAASEQTSFATAYWGMREHLSQIDRVLSESARIVEERRLSLITAAVTGEFDVSAASSRAANAAMSGIGGVG